MTTNALIPQAFWFRLSAACPRIEDLPRPKGRLLDLPASCRLPVTTRLDGREPWADVRVAWNARGLGVTVETAGKNGPFVLEDRLAGADGFQIWIDTRDTRKVARATRFCHRFSAHLAPGSSRGSLDLKVVPRTIARAVADAPLCDPSLIRGRAERKKDGWLAEVFFPAEALSGFDPETNRRLGFAYQVSDPDREDQFLGVGRDFPVGENPSLWSTLELRDSG
ncbi:MAG: hypothetical protein P4L84_25890 [Isosphaeraceae bacterium]|nr:hypothetical protein [Isosphaeraceae bacterium]